MSTAGRSQAPGGAAPTIQVREVGRWFGSVVALSDVSFDLGPGVTALLGPNGAGKSTLFRIIAGLASPSQGTVRILGEDPRKNPALARRIGLVSQQDRLFEHLSGLEMVHVAARLYGLCDALEEARRALSRVELDPSDRRPVAAYSKGMRQRVKVAQAIVHDPEVLVLDEPLNGLDPRQRLRTIELLREMGERGRTVVVSSHVLEEVERFGERILVVVNGRLVAEGPPAAIRDLMEDRPRLFRIGTDRPHALAAALLAEGTVVGAQVVGAGLEVQAAEASRLRLSVAGAARRADARLSEVVALDEDLDSVFAYLLGRR